MRCRVVVCCLLFFFAGLSLADEETQGELYYRALKAEESGDITRALALFDSAVTAGGPYTAELQEIIDDYNEALFSNSWEFHSSGRLGYVGLLYKSRGISGSEFGSEIATAATASLEYDSWNWSHSFDLSVSGGWFADKDDMRSLDTSAWETSLGVGYGLVGKSLALDVGANFNVSEVDDWVPEFYAMFEFQPVHLGTHKLGISLWGYENLDGPLYAAAYVSWRRYVKYGWKASVFAGARFEADSISTPYWLKWFGPSFNPSLSFRFKTEISIDAKANLFYGYVVDGPDKQYEKVEKLSGSWAVTLSWKPCVFGVYAGVEQFYRLFFAIPKKYKYFTEPRRTFFTEFKAGVSWEI